MGRLFLSYSRSDRDAVAPLVKALIALGVDVFQDTANIAPFDPIHERILAALEESVALLAWYSKDYAGKRYCQGELTAAWLAGEAGGQPEKRILVVNPEDGVDHIQPAKLRDHLAAGPAAIAKPKQLARLIQTRLEALSEPLGEARAQTRGWIGRRPPAERGFVGRQLQLWQIHSGLKPGATTVIRAAANPAGQGQARVQGLGGVGKTMLAEEYALRFERGYPGGVFWLSASDGDAKLPENFDLRRLGQLDGLARESYPPGETFGKPQNQVVATFLHDLRRPGHAPYLWVVDDWPHGASGAELEAWRAPGPAGHTLITTRERGVTGTGAAIDVDCLEPDEALALLSRHRALADEGERDAARTIAARLGGHALALDVAGAVIGQRGYRRFLEMLDRAPAKALALATGFGDALPTGHERDIAATLAWSLSKLDEPGRDLLRLATRLATAPIPHELLAAALAEADNKTAEDADLEVTATVAAVRRRSLLTVTDAGITVHVLVGHALDSLHPAPERAATLRAAAVKALWTVFAKHANDIREHATLRPLEPHARHLTAATGDESGLTLLGWLGRYDRERGAYPAAAAALRRQEQGWKALFGPEHLDTVTAMAGLALTLWNQGDLAEAHRLEEEVLVLRRRLLGPEHPDTLDAMDNLAGTLHSQGDLAGARKLHEEVLALRRSLLGPEHPDTLRAMANLAVTLWMQGDPAEAHRLEEEVLALRRRLLGPEHPTTLISMDNLAGTLHAQGNLAGARQLYEEVLALRHRLLGPEHPNTFRSMHNLAWTLFKQGEAAAAAALMAEALAGCRRVLGDGHPQTVTAAENLALIRAASSRAAERETG